MFRLDKRNQRFVLTLGTKTNPESLGWGDPRAVKVNFGFVVVRFRSNSFSFLKDYLEGRGLSVWMDIARLGKSGVIQDIVHVKSNSKTFFFYFEKIRFCFL